MSQFVSVPRVSTRASLRAVWKRYFTAIALLLLFTDTFVLVRLGRLGITFNAGAMTTTRMKTRASTTR